ncbi:hypothetical protein PROFUN_13131 [Planoprotostelium fungivorum]|uniref:BZIP domain-containing protein n=1 Tax=Planoprotostelium fungivorum TaxID=1890364 RepID=A0A2P6N532_9EUKA|nr:hypothetical protein PROFUN_13131 [Planoprotostelium fungivorum]
MSLSAQELRRLALLSMPQVERVNHPPTQQLSTDVDHVFVANMVISEPTTPEMEEGEIFPTSKSESKEVIFIEEVITHDSYILTLKRNKNQFARIILIRVDTMQASTYQGTRQNTHRAELSSHCYSRPDTLRRRDAPPAPSGQVNHNGGFINSTGSFLSNSGGFLGNSGLIVDTRELEDTSEDESDCPSEEDRVQVEDSRERSLERSNSSALSLSRIREREIEALKRKIAEKERARKETDTNGNMNPPENKRIRDDVTESEEREKERRREKEREKEKERERREKEREERRREKEREELEKRLETIRGENEEIVLKIEEKRREMQELVDEFQRGREREEECEREIESMRGTERTHEATISNFHLSQGLSPPRPTTNECEDIQAHTSTERDTADESDIPEVGHTEDMNPSVNEECDTNDSQKREEKERRKQEKRKREEAVEEEIIQLEEERTEEERREETEERREETEERREETEERREETEERREETEERTEEERREETEESEETSEETIEVIEERGEERGEERKREESILEIFRGYRLHPEMIKSGQTHSNRYSHKIDPNREFCRFELHGTCLDDSCPWQHQRMYTMNEAEILCDIAAYKYGQLNQPSHSQPREPQTGGTVEGISQVVRSLSTLKNRSLSEKCQILVDSLQLNSNGSHIIPLKPRLNAILSQVRDRVLPSAPKPFNNLKRKKRKTEEGRAKIEENKDPMYIPLYEVEGTVNDNETERYWSQHTDEDYYQVQMLIDPHNPHLYIDWSKMYVEMDEKGMMKKKVPSQTMEDSRDKALGALARGLEKNRTSEEIWMIYLQLYKTLNNEKEMEDLSRKAVRYNPRSIALYRMRAGHSKKLKERLQVWTEAAEYAKREGWKSRNACQSNYFHDLSYILLEFTFLQSSSGNIDEAISTLRHCFLSGIIPNLFDPRCKQCCRWVNELCIYYLHLGVYHRWVDERDEANTCRYPNGFKRSAYNVYDFHEIDWSQVDEIMKSVREVELLQSNPSLIRGFYWNLIPLLSVLHRTDEARSMCQSMLKISPHDLCLWSIYTSFEHLHSALGMRIIVMALDKYGYPFELVWQVMSMMEQSYEEDEDEKEKRMIQLLIKAGLYQREDLSGASRDFLSSLVTETNAPAPSSRIIKEATEVYEEYLHRREEKEEHRVDAGWLCYLRLVRFTAQSEQFEQIAQKALINCKSNTKELLWRSWLKYKISQGEEVFRVMQEELSDKYRTDRQQYEEREYMSSISQHHKRDTFENLTQLQPKNVDLHLMAAKYEEEKRNYYRAKALVLNSLKNTRMYPHSDSTIHSWKKLVEIEKTQRHNEEAIGAARHAVQTVPYSVILWDEYEDILVQTGQKETLEKVKQERHTSLTL